LTDTVSPEEGKFYRTRGGQKAGPAQRLSDRDAYWPYVWRVPIEGAVQTYLYNNSGVFGDERDPSRDLIAEWVEPCPLGQHDRGADDNCTICGATPDQVNAQARDAMTEADIPVEPDPPSDVEHDIKAHIADEAKRIVSGARRSAYGTPEQNFERIARFWQAYFENTGRGDARITAADISPLMRLMKEARLCETPDHLDSHIDLAGYTLTGAEVNGVKLP
jgi:hypothetical protein